MAKPKKKAQNVYLNELAVDKAWKLANQDNRSFSNEIETLILNEAGRRGV